MGTRSLTHVKEDGETLVTIYRQFDGYPTGLGDELKQFLTQFTVVNGIPVGDTRKLANGAGCLAAQLIAYLKGEEAGNVYIAPADAHGCGEEYVYEIDIASRVGIGEQSPSIMFTVKSAYQDAPIYTGPVEDFDAATAEDAA